MKNWKRAIVLPVAVAMAAALTSPVYAEKMEVTLTEADKCPDAALSEPYRSLFTYESITVEGSDTVMNYRLYVPEDYDSRKAYPVILFLHGAGESNDGSNTNEAQLNVGMMNDFFSRGYYKTFPCIIVAPQVPKSPSGTTGEWVNVSWKSGSYEMGSMTETDRTFTENIQLAKAAVDKTAKTYSVDPDRIYVTGVSMGGYGTWNIITHYSDYFAAAMPICGAGAPGKAELLRDMPIWCFHGDQDSAVPVSGSRDMYEAVTALGGSNIRYTEWKGEGHTWTPAYMREDVWQWLFAQSRNTVDVTELSGKWEALKAIDQKRLTEEDKTKVQVAISCCESVLAGAKTAANVQAAVTLADEALQVKLKPAFPWLWVGVGVGVLAVGVAAVLFGKKKKK